MGNYTVLTKRFMMIHYNPALLDGLTGGCYPSIIAQQISYFKIVTYQYKRMNRLSQTKDTPRTDAELVRSVLASNKEDFTILMNRYQQKIFAYLYRFLYQDKEAAIDLTQDVFIKVYQNLGSVDTDRPLQPWIYRIAHNEAANFLRAKSSKKESQLSDERWQSFSIPEESDPLESEEYRELVLRGLEMIDKKYKEVLVLFFFEELSYQEIAEILDSSTNTVGTFIRRGKQQLQKKLKHIIGKHDLFFQMVFFTKVILLAGIIIIPGRQHD